MHEIRGKQRQFFAAALCFRMLFELFAFRREADTEGRIGSLGNRLDDVRIEREFKGRNAALFLDFLHFTVGDVVVRDCGDRYKYVRAVCLGVRRFEHLPSGFDAKYLRCCRRFECDGSRNQCHPGAGFQRGASHGIAHFSRAAIGQAAHWIDGFESGAGRDNHMCAGQ